MGKRFTKKKRKKKTSIIIIVLEIVLLLVAIFFLLKIVPKNNDSDVVLFSKCSIIENLMAESELNSDQLILVNKEHAVPDNYAADLVSFGNNKQKANSMIISPMNTMVSDAKAKGYVLNVVSAYRSNELQQKLIDQDYQEYIDKGYSKEEALKNTYDYLMPPGYSEHHTGLALDILCDENEEMDATQANEAGNKWMLQNCTKYGFILRYPKGFEDITGCKYEPWHLRYVGTPVAEFITSNNITFEDFVEILQADKSQSAVLLAKIIRGAAITAINK